MEQIKIATFGCWNRKVEEDGKIPMTLVTDNIKSKETDYSDLVILGDNYYAKKTKIKVDGVKVTTIDYKQEDLEYGFELVENINIPNKYLIMGNHDIEDTIGKNCIGLQSQVNKTDKFNVMFPFNSKIIELVDGTKIKYIFIDTTIYSSKFSPSCYDSVLQKNVSTIIQEQNEFIVNELNDDSIKFFLIFGHEPLYSIKTKFSEEKQKYRISDAVLIELSELILNNSLGKNISYICADVHMYQSGTVSNNTGASVKQIVCGTGGADKDYFVIDEKTFTKDNLTYDINITKDSYGYVELIIDNNGVTHNYINVLMDSTTKVYNKKYYIQYKNVL